MQTANTLALKATTPNVEASAAIDISQIRIRLQEALALSKRATLYDGLGISPSASDTEISVQIDALAVAAARSGNLPSGDMRYAIDILRNPAKRENYDRTLWAEMESARQALHAISQGSAAAFRDIDDIPVQWWYSKKFALFVAILAISLAGIQIKNQREEKVREQARAQIAEREKQEYAEARRQEGEERARLAEIQAERTAEMQRRSFALQEDAERRRRDELDSRLYVQRAEHERRAQAQQQMDERRERMEAERRAEKEKKYWACMNAQLSNGVRNAQANLSCSR